MGNFLELVKTRRSIRKYLEKEVETEKIERILQAALMSPSSKRKMPWEFFVVKNTEKLAKLATAREFGSAFLQHAPAAIVVTADAEKTDVWFEDAAIAATFLQLAAHDEGLASCWVQIFLREHSHGISAEDFVKQTLEIPQNLRVLCIISLGYKNEERKPFELENLAYEKIHFLG